MIYGSIPFHIDDDRTDIVGIRTITYSKIWQPSRWPLSIPELDAETPEPPEINAAMELVLGPVTSRINGGLRSAWTFRGVRGDGKGVTFKTRDTSTDYQFDPGFAQVPMAMHPDLAKLLDAYGGTVVDGQIFWPQDMPAASGSGGLSGGSNKSSEKKKNPMFGQEHFLRLEGTYTHRYVSPSLAAAEAGVGRIFQSGALPGRAPTYSDRDWLKAPAPYRSLGKMLYEITEIYWLSGVGGWPRPVYGNVSAGAARAQSLQSSASPIGASL